MTRMRISVVIPVFDRRELVGRAIRSVFDQTLSPLEVIVVDDASRDDSAGLIRKQFPEVCVLENDRNRGVSFSRNRGIRHARGDWVAFLDSDDEWLPEKLWRQAALLDSEPDAPLVHGDEIWIRNGVRVNPKRKHAKHGGWIFERCLPLCVISPSAAIIRRDLLNEIGGFDEFLPVCEDYDLWLRICARFPVAFATEPLLVKYGGHGDQLSRRHWGMDRFRVMALWKLLSGSLATGQRRVVLATIMDKLEILRGGAARRGRLAPAFEWSRQLERVRSMYDASADSS